MNIITKEVRVQPGKKRNLFEHEPVRCVVQGERFAEVIAMDKEPKPGVIKLSKTHYKVISTGEIKEYTYSDTKQVGNLSKTFNELRYLIRTNFAQSAKNQLFLTLTYANNMTNPEQLYEDFKNFMARLRYRYKEHRFDYIVVMEPQGRGAWHAHVMLKSDKERLYLPHEEVSAVWGDENIARQALINTGEYHRIEVRGMALGKVERELKRLKVKLPKGYTPIVGHGWTTTEVLRSDDVGTYYVAYFTDLTNEASPSSEGKSKARQKGERLHYYPKGFRFYRCSRGIARPERAWRDYGDVVGEYGNPVYVKAYDVVETIEGIDGGRSLNKIQREHFKKAR